MRARMATSTHTASKTTCERAEEVAMRPAAVDSETVAKIMTIRITEPHKTHEPGPCGFSFQTARGTVMMRSRKTITAPMSKRISIGAAPSIVQRRSGRKRRAWAVHYDAPPKNEGLRRFIARLQVEPAPGARTPTFTNRYQPQKNEGFLA